MTFRNAFQVTAQALKNVDWQALSARMGAGLAAAWVVAQLFAMVAMMVAEAAYENRQDIRDAAVKAAAAFIVTAEAVYNAGTSTRNWVERMNDSSAEILREMPEQLSAVAPIAAPVVAVAKSATAALTNWLQFSDEEAEGSDTPEEVTEPANEGFGEQLVRNMDELMALPAATLREMVGTRARYPKAKLVAMLMVA